MSQYDVSRLHKQLRIELACMSEIPASQNVRSYVQCIGVSRKWWRCNMATRAARGYGAYGWRAGLPIELECFTV